MIINGGQLKFSHEQPYYRQLIASTCVPPTKNITFGEMEYEKTIMEVLLDFVIVTRNQRAHVTKGGIGNPN